MKILFFLTSIILVCLNAPLAYSQTKYFLIGGNTNPFDSQITLEKNIIKFQSSFKDEILKNHVITHFGWGNEGYLDVSIIDPSFTIDDELFADLFPSRYYANYIIRANKVMPNHGPVTKQALLDSAKNLLDSTMGNTKFRLYFSGHGAYQDDKDDYYLSMGESSLYATELTEVLDAFSPDAHWQLVLPQCHSGGFARINFEGALEGENILSKANRCAFCSTLPDLISTGCSAHSSFDEEYSRYFHEAFFEKKNIADYDKNGFITSDEAHAYTYIYSKTIDIPVKTSDALLRQMADSRFLDSFQNLDTLFSTMDIYEKATFLGLSKRANDDFTHAAYPYIYAKEMRTKMASEFNHENHIYHDIQKVLDQNFKPLQNDFLKKYPYLYNVYGANHGAERIIMDDQINTLKKAFFTDQRYPNIKSLLQNVRVQSDIVLQKDVNWALWKRIEYLLETQLLKNTLLQDQAIYKKFLQLKECENKPFFDNEDKI